MLSYVATPSDELLFCVLALMKAAGQATLSLFAEGRKLALEELKLALESWRQTPAIARCASEQLFQCNA